MPRGTHGCYTRQPGRLLFQGLCETIAQRNRQKRPLTPRVPLVGPSSGERPKPPSAAFCFPPRSIRVPKPRLRRRCEKRSRMGEERKEGEWLLSVVPVAVRPGRGPQRRQTSQLSFVRQHLLGRETRAFATSAPCGFWGGA